MFGQQVAMKLGGVLRTTIRVVGAGILIKGPSLKLLDPKFGSGCARCRGVWRDRGVSRPQ